MKLNFWVFDFPVKNTTPLSGGGHKCICVGFSVGISPLVNKLREDPQPQTIRKQLFLCLTVSLESSTCHLKKIEHLQMYIGLGSARGPEVGAAVGAGFCSEVGAWGRLKTLKCERAYKVGAAVGAGFCSEVGAWVRSKSLKKRKSNWSRSFRLEYIENYDFSPLKVIAPDVVGFISSKSIRLGCYKVRLLGCYWDYYLIELVPSRCVIKTNGSTTPTVLTSMGYDGRTGLRSAVVSFVPKTLDACTTP